MLVTVEVYKCELMALTCGECLTLGTSYECVWCDDQCIHEASCQSADKLTRDDVCPNPQILSVSAVSPDAAYIIIISSSTTTIIIIKQKLKAQIYLKKTSQIRHDDNAT